MNTMGTGAAFQVSRRKAGRRSGVPLSVLRQPLGASVDSHGGHQGFVAVDVQRHWIDEVVRTSTSNLSRVPAVYVVVEMLSSKRIVCGFAEASHDECDCTNPGDLFSSIGSLRSLVPRASYG